MDERPIMALHVQPEKNPVGICPQRARPSAPCCQIGTKDDSKTHPRPGAKQQLAASRLTGQATCCQRPTVQRQAGRWLASQPGPASCRPAEQQPAREILIRVYFSTKLLLHQQIERCNVMTRMMSPSGHLVVRPFLSPLGVVLRLGNPAVHVRPLDLPRAFLNQLFISLHLD